MLPACPSSSGFVHRGRLFAKIVGSTSPLEAIIIVLDALSETDKSSRLSRPVRGGVYDSGTIVLMISELFVKPSAVQVPSE